MHKRDDGSTWSDIIGVASILTPELECAGLNSIRQVRVCVTALIFFSVGPVRFVRRPSRIASPAVLSMRQCLTSPSAAFLYCPLPATWQINAVHVITHSLGEAICRRKSLGGVCSLIWPRALNVRLPPGCHDWPSTSGKAICIRPTRAPRIDIGADNSSRSK